jgi:hypothetical protein
MLQTFIDNGIRSGDKVGFPHRISAGKHLSCFTYWSNGDRKETYDAGGSTELDGYNTILLSTPYHKFQREDTFTSKSNLAHNWDSTHPWSVDGVATHDVTSTQYQTVTKITVPDAYTEDEKTNIKQLIQDIANGDPITPVFPVAQQNSRPKRRRYFEQLNSKNISY